VAIAKRARMARLLRQRLRNRFLKNGGNQMSLNSRVHMRF
jgi:hypothetical protein